MSLIDRKSLQTRCKELNLPRCNEKSELLRKRIAERQSELLQQTGLLDLPAELLMDEILPSINIRDLLSLCSTNRSLSRLCHDGEFLSRILRSYDYLELQEAIKYWGWTGRMIDLLIKLVDELKGKIEFSTIHSIYLYLMERNDSELTNYASMLKERTTRAEAMWHGAFFPSYDQLWTPVKEFVDALRNGASYIDISDRMMKIDRDLFVETYLADLIIKTLPDDKIRVFLSDEYYYAAKKDNKFDGRFVQFLYDALVRSQRIDVLDPLFLRRWNGDYDAKCRIDSDQLYGHVNLEQETQIVQYHQANNLPLYRFSHRTIYNRELLLKLEYNEYYEPLIRILDSAYHFVSPEELYTILIRTTKNDPLAITIIAKNVVYYAKAYGFSLWARKMVELVPNSDNRSW